MPHRVSSGSGPYQAAELQKMTMAELRDLARGLELSGHSRLKKSELVEQVKNASQELGAQAESCEDEDSLEVVQVAPFWLSATWSVSVKTLKRAAAAMKEDWHRSVLVLRLFRVQHEDSGPRSRELVKDIPLPDGTRKWFVELDDQTFAWKLELGYRAGDRKFFSLLQSSEVDVPENQKDLTPLGGGVSAGTQVELVAAERNGDVRLRILGELSLKGDVGTPCSAVVDGEYVQVHADEGVFYWSRPLENGRMVIPVVVECGNQRQRAVVAVDSNVHYLEVEHISPGSRKSTKD
ncbi:hypothetical protein KOR42_17660 [Thalassoglobus neptunius]|uniref:Rho termination factor-like N-terminal domain-containing protein n=1 Tax=Thalassoglobus neptunius TaxID=1938619 RepID=A0A5C5X949_9PLAN|nr:DUF4912 domain-containing protein [Thalassoglobus neptunius]TWT58392.1 hypothetical protein KOR42_17660 [Thalassoglobus neptunius]